MRRKYHSDLIIQFKLGILPKEVTKSIPPSTRSYWNINAYDNYFAADTLYAQQENMKMIKALVNHRRLFQVTKVICKVFFVYQAFMISCKQFQKQVFESKDLVVKTIEKCRSHLGFDRTLRLFQISKHQFYAWKNSVSCSLSVFNKCLRKYPNQLSVPEVNVMKQYLTNPDFKGWSNASVYFQMMRDRAANMSLTSFYRYASKLKLTKPRIKKPKQRKGIRSNATQKLFHMDMTIFRLPDNRKAYVYVLVDNYSRFILNATASLAYSPQITFQNLSEGFSKYQIKPDLFDVKLMCDGGVENKGVVDDFVNQNLIRKIIAQKDVTFSNSMVESVIKRMKYDFLY